MARRKVKQLTNGYGKEVAWYDNTKEYINFCDELSKKLYKITYDAGKTQAEMADLLLTNRQTISDIARRGGLSEKEKAGERTIRKTPAYFILKYAEITGISPNEILRYKKSTNNITPAQQQLLSITSTFDDKQLQLLIKIAEDIKSM